MQQPACATSGLLLTLATTQRNKPRDAECLATLVRRAGASSRLHWLGDARYSEDNPTVHTRSGHCVMATLRKLVIGAARLTGRRDITEATRDRHHPFKIIKFASA
jgi:hypothetical protein